MVRGSFLMQRLIEAGQSAYWRRGKPMRRQQLTRLTTIRSRLQDDPRHDTLDAAIKDLARMTLDAVCASPRTPQRGPQRTPQHAPQERRRADDDVALYVTRRRTR